jgi:hypothetical protein
MLASSFPFVTEIFDTFLSGILDIGGYLVLESKQYDKKKIILLCIPRLLIIQFLMLFENIQM